MLRYALAPVLPRAAASVRVPLRLARGATGVALTFDDGPHPEGTPLVLDVLERFGARAVFFVVGEQVRARPAVVSEIAKRGHVVALHGYRHRLQLRMSASEVSADVDAGLSVVADAVGLRPLLHRPPYGIYSPAGLEAVRAAGLQPLLWSRWGKDWRKFTTPGRIARRALSDVGPRDVILLHDADFYSARNSHRRTVRALEIILTELRAREIATVLPV